YPGVRRVHGYAVQDCGRPASTHLKAVRGLSRSFTYIKENCTMQNREIDIIGVQTDLGASKRGVNMGPMAMRYGGLCEGIRELGYNIYDLGDIFPMATGESKATMRNY